MIVNGVNFNEERVKKMDKKAFIDMHINVFFLDISESDRKKRLSDIYDKIKDVGVSVAKD